LLRLSWHFYKGEGNFTKQQIDNYTAMALTDPMNHTVIKKISLEQLDYILTFLRLKKKGT